MCGIAGFNFLCETTIRKMNEIQKHRGPDGDGIFCEENISLGHRRLAIIDLSENANQPMHYQDLTITYNGEIYNFLEIKNELIELGHHFVTNSDTEVILHAYKEWEHLCLNKFNGMWAFAIYDKSNNKLFLARDRFGIKPLYYYHKNNKFIFASEIKAIKAHNIELSINMHSLNFYFYQKYVNSLFTIYNEIMELATSHYMIYDLKNNIFEIKKYYDLEAEVEEQKKLPLKERIIKIKEILPDAIIKTLVADVKVGSFLSGGIDSAFISAIIAQYQNKYEAFTIGFNEKTFDELDYAKIVTKHYNIKHFYQIIDIEEDTIFNVIQKLDQPFGDPSLIPTYILSKITRQNVTVAISGDGSDEIFAGYDSYLAYKVAKLIPNIAVKIFNRIANLLPASDKNLHFTYKIKKFFADYDKNINIRHLNWMSQTTINQRKNLLGNYFTPIKSIFQGKTLLTLQLNDFYNYLSNDILRKTDKASMLNSLEVRVPYLDFRLVPLVLSLPEYHKIRLFKTKSLFKEICRTHLPQNIIHRKKQGFSVPIAVWFKKSAKMQTILTDTKYFSHGLFDYSYVQTLLTEHLNAKQDNSRILWLILIFNYWWITNSNLAELILQ